MNKIDTDELLNQLEQTYVLLKEDTQALTYLYDISLSENDIHKLELATQMKILKN